MGLSAVAAPSATLTASVIVCTRNRADDLAELLANLSAQRTQSDLEWEIVVVDNASDDATPRVVARVAEKCRVEVRYVHEPRLGLSRARNRGWREARGAIAVYVDDDVVPGPNWLREHVASYDAPRVAATSGRLFPLVDEPSLAALHPAWLLHYRFDYGERRAPLTTLSGGNMSFRREILAALGGFDEELGRMGDCLLAGDEVGIGRAIRRFPGRWRIEYVPGAVVHHKVEATGLDDDLLEKRNYCGGVSNACIDRKAGSGERVNGRLRRALRLGQLELRKRWRGALELHDLARLAEIRGYERERRGGPELACRGCPMAPLRLGGEFGSRSRA